MLRATMTRQEAKLALAAYRPNGADATDSRLAEALACAQNDPELAAWFLSQQQFDSAVAAKLGAVAPPRILREAILVSLWFQPRLVSRRSWLAAAAVVIL